MCANCMVHSGYEASAVDHTFGSVKGFFSTVRATVFGRYKNPQAMKALEENDDPAYHGAVVPLTIGGSKHREPETVHS